MTIASVAPDNTVWPPCGQIAQPAGPVDRRPDVVSFVAQLDVAGVEGDAQPDREQRGQLQVERAQATASLARLNAITKLSPSPWSIGRTPL